MIEAREYVHNASLIELGELSTAGQSTAPVRLVGESGGRKIVYQRLTFQLVVALGGSKSVTLQAEGNLDNSADNWANLDVSGLSTIIATGGTYILTYEGSGEVGYTRLTFVSEAGGSDATIQVKLRVKE